MAPDFLTLVDLLSKGSVVVLAFFLVGFLFELVVPGRTYKSLKEDCKRKDDKIDELNDALLAAVRLASRVVKGRGGDAGKGEGGP